MTLKLQHVFHTHTGVDQFFFLPVQLGAVILIFFFFLLLRVVFSCYFPYEISHAFIP